jgi:hypothetical protein
MLGGCRVSLVCNTAWRGSFIDNCSWIARAEGWPSGEGGILQGNEIGFGLAPIRDKTEVARPAEDSVARNAVVAIASD